MPAVRQLCPRCLASFEGARGSVCASCASLDARRTAGAMDMRTPGAASPAPRASARISAAPSAEGRAASWLRAELAEAREWCREHSPWWRLALWAYIAWTVARHVQSDESYRSVFDGLNFGLHELGHELFQPLGPWLHVAGGTLTQLAAPWIGLLMFRRQGDWFGVSVAISWLATNLFGIAVYMGDARARELPLASPHVGVVSGEEARGLIGHDWEYLLGHARLLHLDTALAAGVHTLAVVTMALGLTMGAALLVGMWRARCSAH